MCHFNVLHNWGRTGAFPACLRTDSACTQRLWLTGLHVSFSVARQFSQLRVFFSTVHGLSCCFLHIFVGSSHAKRLWWFLHVAGEFASQSSVGTDLPSTSEDGEGDYIEVPPRDDFYSLLFVGTVFAVGCTLQRRWRGMHLSVLRRARGSCFMVVRDWNCGIRDRTKLSGSLQISTVTLGSDGGGCTQFRL